MTTSYPGAIWVPTIKTDKVDLVEAEHVNRLQREEVAVQTELGVGVKGSKADLTDRLGVMLASNGALRNGSSFPTAGNYEPMQLFYKSDEDIVYARNSGDSVWFKIGESLSNVIAMWVGVDNAATSALGFHCNSQSTAPTWSTAANVNNVFWGRQTVNTTDFFTIVPLWKWRKISGVNTVRAHIRGWRGTVAGNFIFRAIVGSVTGDLTVSADHNTPMWRSEITLDVSGLVDGTVYDCSIAVRTPTGGGIIIHVSGYVFLGE
jgi:hypothetical protein